MFSTLPDAVMREREAMLSAALELLRAEGYEELRAHDLAGYPEPEEGLVHVINAPVQPDLTAAAPGEPGPVTGYVEVSTALSGDTVGRRWQYLWSWTRDHHGKMVIFVHPEDRQKALAIARHWHIDPNCIRSLGRH